MPDSLRSFQPPGWTLNEAQLVTALAVLRAFTWSPDELPAPRRIEHLPYAPYLHALGGKVDGSIEVVLDDISGADVFDAGEEQSIAFWIDEDGTLCDYEDGERIDLALAMIDSRVGGHHYRATLLRVNRVDADSLDLGRRED